MNGFTFNGRHSSEFGIIMRSKNRPILPEPRITVEEIPARDGDYDYTEVNPDNRAKYKSRPIEIECSFNRRDMTYLMIRSHEIASWLACGEKELIFDDETAVYYLGRVENKLDLSPVIARIGRFTIQFKCRPYGFSRVKSDEQLQFGQGLILGYGYRLDMVPTVFKVTGTKTLNIYNPGTYVKPTIKINGTLTDISFTVGSKTLTYDDALSNADVEINLDNPKAVKDGVENVSNHLSGNIFEFSNGNNSMAITGTNLNCTVTLTFRYLYF